MTVDTNTSQAVSSICYTNSLSGVSIATLGAFVKTIRDSAIHLIRLTDLPLTSSTRSSSFSFSNQIYNQEQFQ
jgi:hypothetical protein